MAAIVYIYANNQTGQEALGAIRQISAGFATLDRLDGLRAKGEHGDAEVEAAVRLRVRALCERFPIYPGV